MVRMENRTWVLMRLLPQFNGQMLGMGSAALTASFSEKSDMDDFLEFTKAEIPVITRIRKMHADGRVVVDLVLE